MIGSGGYTRQTLHKELFATHVENAVENLSNVQFDAIAVRGTSGTIFGGAIAHRLGKNLILVRKPNDSSHSIQGVEGYAASGETFIFLDDFVGSGATRQITLDAVQGADPSLRYVGTYECHYNKFTPAGQEPNYWPRGV